MHLMNSFDTCRLRVPFCYQFIQICTRYKS